MEEGFQVEDHAWARVGTRIIVPDKLRLRSWVCELLVPTNYEDEYVLCSSKESLEPIDSSGHMAGTAFDNACRAS